MDQIVYFSDQFFSTGRTDIYNGQKEIKGALDLKSSFTSSLNVEDERGEVLMEAAFPFLLGKWTIWDSKGKVMGELKANFSLFTKKYIYMTNSATYPIDSPAFSGEYTIYNESEKEVATFKKVNGFFQASAYELYNQSETLLTEELVAVVMGINAIEKRRRSSAAGGGA